MCMDWGTDNDEFVEVVIISALTLTFISLLFQLFVSFIPLVCSPKEDI